MSAQREWQPGDAARIGGVGGLALRTNDGRWVTMRSVGGVVLYDHEEIAHPLVVIDPEDREQIERLWRAWRDLAPDHSLAQDNLQAALREFANPTPPKPEEPTGLGAVVEDIEGIRWTRVESGEARTRNPWYPADSDFQPDEWHNLCAIRVLSEGVTQ